jgi:hypothetical protein
MKTTDQILEYLSDRIGHVYFRPLMYGGSPGSVDLILYYYHELWSEILECQDDFNEYSQKVHQDENCGSSDFSTRFIINNPGASDEDIAKYIVIQWMKISKLLKIPIKYDDLSIELNMALP